MDTADSRAVDTQVADSRAAGKDKQPAGVAADKVVVAARRPCHPSVAQAVAVPRQQGLDAMYCRNLSTERTSLSVPVDPERHYIALRRLGRK